MSTPAFRASVSARKPPKSSLVRDCSGLQVGRKVGDGGVAAKSAAAPDEVAQPRTCTWIDFGELQTPDQPAATHRFAHNHSIEVHPARVSAKTEADPKRGERRRTLGGEEREAPETNVEGLTRKDLVADAKTCFAEQSRSESAATFRNSNHATSVTANRGRCNCCVQRMMPA